MEATTFKQVFDENGRIRVLNAMRYFYSRTENRNYTPRFDIMMKDSVDISCLQTALEAALDRFRVFRLMIITHEEYYYLVDNPEKPLIHIYNGTPHNLCSEANNNHVIWVDVDDRRIIIEFFHGIADGHGFTPFLQHLLEQYCALRYQNDYSTVTNAISPEQQERECMESLFAVDEKQKNVKHILPYTKVFHFSDSQMMPSKTCVLYRLRADADTLNAYVKKTGANRTALFSVLMNCAITAKNPLNDSCLVTAVAADVRKFLGVEDTLRDCAYTLPLWFDSEDCCLPRQNQLQVARKRIMQGMSPELRLADGIEEKKNNIQIERMLATMDAKKRFVTKVHERLYENYTYSMSNVGRVTFGDSVDQHVDTVEAMIVANTYPLIISALQFKDQYFFTYCTRIENDPYVHEFQRLLEEAGIACTCLAPEFYTEPGIEI